MTNRNDEHIFYLLNEYMFTTNNISRLHDNSCIPKQTPLSFDKLCNKKQTVSKDAHIAANIETKIDFAQEDRLYYPKQHDKLFWCFYIFLYGKVDYDYVTHVFEVEKKIKIESAAKLRGMKALLRTHKLKYTDIEKELVNIPKITIKGLHALCILYKVSITYISGNIYYILGNTNEDASYKNCIIIAHSSQKITSGSHMQSNLQIGAQLKANDTYIKNICQSKIRIKNYNKPLLSIASYTLPILHEMANILHINLYNDSGKKKLKKDIYQEVSEKII